MRVLQSPPQDPSRPSSSRFGELAISHGRRGSQDVVNLEYRTISRKMAATAPLVDFLDAGFSKLRRDGEALELLMLEFCEVGSSALFWIQVRNDHIPTSRTTSPVVRIEPLD